LRKRKVLRLEFCFIYIADAVGTWPPCTPVYKDARGAWCAYRVVCSDNDDGWR